MRFIELFEANLAEFGPRTAVVDHTGTYTYRELGEASTPHTERLVVGGRSFQFLAKLLGAWRSGIAPLPTDACQPSQRLELLERLLEQPTEGAEYLCATSGSSGVPKVVMVGEGSLLRTIRQQLEAFEVSAESRYLWMLSTGFDASLSDICVTLAAGGCLVCAGDWSSELPHRLEENQITHIDIPPSVLSLYEPSEFPKSLQTIIVGGEPSAPEHLRRWAKTFRVVAVYGPTEATICSSLSLVDDDWDEAYIGKPLKGVKYSIEDGELVIEGGQVALGYLGGPDFQRRYQTGDLVAIGGSHGCRFVGRKDRQVQLNGRRLELGEIEYYACMKAPSAAFVARSELSLCWQGELSVEEMRRHLEAHLPNAVIPTRMGSVESLPRLLSGKVDYPQLGNCYQSSLARVEILLEQERLASSKTVEELEPPTRPTWRGSISSLKTVLLTGATGRLGRRLLPRLERRFTVWKLGRRAQGDGCLVGDLSQPDLGLSSEQWSFLKTEADAVINLAGSLELNRTYQELYPVNSAALVQLAQLGKPIYHASTMATTLSAKPSSWSGEPQEIFGGYAQTKWVAERILCDWPGVTWRYGQLLAEPDDDELLSLVVRGLLEFGAYPVLQDPHHRFDVTPLEWAVERSEIELLDERQVVDVRRGWSVHFSDLIELLKERGHLLEPMTGTNFRALPALSRETQMCQLSLFSRMHWSLFLAGSQPELEETNPEALTCLGAYLDHFR